MNQHRPWKEKNFPPASRQVLRDHSWVRRNPRLFASLFSGGCLLILFSRPIYDIFFRESFERKRLTSK